MTEEIYTELKGVKQSVGSIYLTLNGMDIDVTTLPDEPSTIIEPPANGAGEGDNSVTPASLSTSVTNGPGTPSPPAPQSNTSPNAAVSTTVRAKPATAVRIPAPKPRALPTTNPAPTPATGGSVINRPRRPPAPPRTGGPAPRAPGGPTHRAPPPPAPGAPPGAALGPAGNSPASSLGTKPHLLCTGRVTKLKYSTE